MRNLAPWFGLIFGVAICCALAALFHENPLHILKILSTSFWASKYDLGLTLFYTTCLIFSGLAFAIPMKAGLFHIGSEGQILISALVAAWLGGALQPLPGTAPLILTVLFIFAATLLTGALAAWIVAAFKIFRQAHEVVVAIMLNFILAALSTWATVNRLQSPDSQNPETALIAAPFRFLQNDFLKQYFEQSPVSSFLLVAVAACLALAFLEKQTLLGHQLTAFGQNPHAASRLGIGQARMLLISLGLAGAFSALAGLTEVFGNAFQYRIGFSPEYGFLGIAVALLARQNFIGLIGSAFLMACLHKGASDLDLETEFLTRDFSRVLQAVIIFSVAASYYLFSHARRIPGRGAFRRKEGE